MSKGTTSPEVRRLAMVRRLELALARNGVRVHLTEGVTNDSTVWMERARRTIVRHDIADRPAGVLDGRRISLAQAFEATFGEPLEETEHV